MDDADFVEVYAAANVPEANFVKLVLADLGIDSVILNEPIQTVAGEIPLGYRTAPRVCVAKADQKRARHAILEWEEDRRLPDDSPAWSCRQCDSEVPGNFEICWQCGTPREENADL